MCNLPKRHGGRHLVVLALTLSLLVACLASCADPSDPDQPQGRHLFDSHEGVRISSSDTMVAGGDTLEITIVAAPLSSGKGSLYLRGNLHGEPLGTLLDPELPEFGTVIVPVDFFEGERFTRSFVLWLSDSVNSGVLNAICRFDSVVVGEELIGVESPEFVAVFGYNEVTSVGYQLVLR